MLVKTHDPIENGPVIFEILFDQRQDVRVDIVGRFFDEPDVEDQQDSVV
jgi:hypothetical protein